MTYRMSFRFTPGPPKPKETLAPDEGLADTLVMVSVLGTVGAPEPMSIQVHQRGPMGAEPHDARLAYHIAVVLLTHATETETLRPRLHRAAAAALAALRQPFRE